MENQSFDLIKSQYLCRSALWDWHDNSTIDILTEYGHKLIRLSEWQTVVFFMADGTTSIEQIAQALIQRRGSLSEAELVNQVLTSVNELVHDTHVVELSKNSKDITYKYYTSLGEQKANGTGDY